MFSLESSPIQAMQQRPSVKTYGLYKDGQLLYSCYLTDDQAMAANERFSAREQVSGFFYSPLKSDNETIRAASCENARAWHDRYSNRASITRYPYDWIIGNLLRRKERFEGAPLRVLDFGYGGGNHLWMLQLEGFEPWGIDVSESAKLLALETCSSFGVEINPDRLLVGGADVIGDYPSGFFDFIIDRESLVQLSFDDARIYMAQFKRLLSVNGYYIGNLFSDQHPSTSFGIHQGKGYYSNFKEGLFAGMGGRQFYNLSLIRELFSELILEEVSLSDYRTFIGDSSNNSEYHVVAKNS